MKRRSRLSWRRVLVASCVPLASLSCGGGDSSPASPGAARPVTATSQSLSGACYRLGLGDPGAVCGQGGSPKLVDEVDTAIDLVVQNSPQLFDKTDVAAPNTDLYRVVDSEGYLDAVARTLRVIGVCAQRDPHDPVFERILAKDSNESSEAYDVLTSDGYVRRGSGSFVDLCRPASFPIQRPPDAPPPGSG